MLRVLSTLHPVSGRFEKVRAANGTVAIVDYAHTPDALENVLRTIEEIRTPAQQLIVVCGCGGDRDRTKRPEMAAIAVKYATTAIFTSDNPRHESPEAILDEMVAGLQPGYALPAHHGPGRGDPYGGDALASRGRPARRRKGA